MAVSQLLAFGREGITTLLSGCGTSQAGVVRAQSHWKARRIAYLVPKITGLYLSVVLKFCSRADCLTFAAAKVSPFRDASLSVSTGATSIGFQQFLVRGGEGFGLARCLPQFDVGLQVQHHAFELRQIQRLGAIADGFFGRGVDFDD